MGAVFEDNRQTLPRIPVSVFSLERLRSLAAVAGRKLTPVSRRPRSGRPPGDQPAMAHPFVATMIGGGLEGLRSLAAVAGRKPTPFHGADGADALQGISQRWPIRSWQRCSAEAWRAAVPRSRGRPEINTISRGRRRGPPRRPLAT